MMAPPVTSPIRAAPTSMSSLVARFSRGATGVNRSSYAARKSELRSTTSAPRASSIGMRPGMRKAPTAPTETPAGSSAALRAMPSRSSSSPEGGDLNGNAQQRGDRVEDREEAEQLLARCGGRCRPRLEHVVQHTLGCGGQRHQQGKSEEIGRRSQDSRGPGLRLVAEIRLLSASVACVAPCSTPRTSAAAKQVQRREDRKHGGEGQQSHRRARARARRAARRASLPR